MKRNLARVADFWCRSMHAEPMWPAHGQYECRKCGRQHLVGWEQPLPVQRRTTVPSRETLVPDALVGVTESRIQCS